MRWWFFAFNRRSRMVEKREADMFKKLIMYFANPICSPHAEPTIAGGS